MAYSLDIVGVKSEMFHTGVIYNILDSLQGFSLWMKYDNVQRKKGAKKFFFKIIQKLIQGIFLIISIKMLPLSRGEDIL